jgi:superfamily II DNA/RNA helicase
LRLPDACSIWSSAAQLICRKVEVLVLDEADRMLDMGFLPAIRRSARDVAREASDAFVLSNYVVGDRAVGSFDNETTEARRSKSARHVPQR